MKVILQNNWTMVYMFVKFKAYLWGNSSMTCIRIKRFNDSWRVYKVFRQFFFNSYIVKLLNHFICINVVDHWTVVFIDTSWIIDELLCRRTIHYRIVLFVAIPWIIDQLIHRDTINYWIVLFVDTSSIMESFTS